MTRSIANIQNEIRALEKQLNAKFQKKMVDWGIAFRDRIKLAIIEGGDMPVDTERLKDSVTLVEPPVGPDKKEFGGSINDLELVIMIDTSADEGIRNANGTLTGRFEEDHQGWVPYAWYVEHGTAQMRAYAPFLRSAQWVDINIITPELNNLITSVANEMANWIAQSFIDMIEDEFESFF